MVSFDLDIMPIQREYYCYQILFCFNDSTQYNFTLKFISYFPYFVPLSFSRVMQYFEIF